MKLLACICMMDMLCFYSFRLLRLVVRCVEGVPIAFPSPLLKSSGVFIKIHVMFGYKSLPLVTKLPLISAERLSLSKPWQNKAPGLHRTSSRCYLQLCVPCQKQNIVLNVQLHETESSEALKCACRLLCLTHESTTTTS